MPITTLAHASAAGIDVTELTYSPGLELPPHAHERAGFCLVIDGSYIEGYGSRDLRCRASSVTFSPAGEEHRNHFDGAPVHCLTVDIPQPLLARLDGAPLRDPFEERGGNLSIIAQRLADEMHTSDDVSPLAIEGLVLAMVANAARVRTDEARLTPMIKRAREIVEARFVEPLSLADIAHAVGRHPVHVASAFRRAYGETVGDCVRRLRIDYVRRELARSELPLADIALSAGFASQSHLTRVFHRATGTTPAAYRVLIRSKRT
ncbi:MAG TPA: AraC family transcriptional regulator [Thermoanaerobaculia bacterium]|nr:AraC family transcriptional regulator [Thermoanaerobaculia bacterium]